MTETAACGTDLLADLERLVPEMPAARERVSLGDELNRIGEWLRLNSALLESFVEFSGLCASLAHEAALSDFAVVRESLEVIDGFASTLAEAQDKGGLEAIWSETKDALSAIKIFTAALRRVYSGLFAAKLQTLGSAGDLIADLDPSSTLGGRLTAFAARAGEVSRAPQAQFPAGVLATLTEAKALRMEIARLATEPEHMAFLDAIIAGQATLRLLTPGVLDWLKRLGDLDRFVIRPQTHR